LKNPPEAKREGVLKRGRGGGKKPGSPKKKSLGLVHRPEDLEGGNSKRLGFEVGSGLWKIRPAQRKKEKSILDQAKGRFVGTVIQTNKGETCGTHPCRGGQSTRGNLMDHPGGGGSGRSTGRTMWKNARPKKVFSGFLLPGVQETMGSTETTKKGKIEKKTKLIN